ncbi:MAG: glycosyltransferase [Patescibacteria group bacterium]
MPNTPVPQNTLLIARARGFWETDRAQELFPRHILLPAAMNGFSYFVYAPYVFLSIFFQRPYLIVFGTTMPYAKIYATLRHWGFLKNTRALTDHQFLQSKDVQAFERVWVYSKKEIELHEPHVRGRFVFLLYPSKVVRTGETQQTKEEYIFSGGNHSRDHEAFLEAMKGLPYKAVVGTNVALTVPIPHNCEVRSQLPLDEYISVMQHARFVVVPLQKGIGAHGHSDLSMAASLGKVVITTKDAGVDEYIKDNVTGIFVAPGDVSGYRDAITRLYEDRGFLATLEKGAQARKEEFSYDTFAKKLEQLIQPLC